MLKANAVKGWAREASAKITVPLEIKQIGTGGHHDMVCLNDRQARKEAKDREATIASLEDQLKKSAKNSNRD